MLMPYKPGLGQGHNQKKDTHTLDFAATLALGAQGVDIAYLPGKISWQKRFNDCSKGLRFGQQTVIA
jgi:hypothetical protein